MVEQFYRKNGFRKLTDDDFREIEEMITIKLKNQKNLASETAKKKAAAQYMNKANK